MNGPLVYLAVRRGPIAEIPWTNFFSRPESLERKVRSLKNQVRTGRVRYLVYFKSDTKTVVTPEQLMASGLELRKVAQYRDGAIWEAVS